jgi:hypothetical protein
MSRNVRRQVRSYGPTGRDTRQLDERREWWREVDRMIAERRRSAEREEDR